MPHTPSYIIVLRHGQRRDDAPDAADEEDPPLTELGKAQTADIAHILQARFGENALYEHAQLFVSPFTRTLETAVILQENGIGLVQPFVVDNELCEVYGPIRIKTDKAPNLAVEKYINTISYSQLSNSRNNNISFSDLLSNHMSEMPEWKILGHLPEWGETIDNASERFVNRFNVIAHEINSVNNVSSSNNCTGCENLTEKDDHKTSDVNDFDDREDVILVSTPITQRNDVFSVSNNNINNNNITDLYSSADQESETHLPECVIRKDRTCDVRTTLRREATNVKVLKPKEKSIHRGKNVAERSNGDGRTSNNVAYDNICTLRIAILITHGDALGAILNHFYPSLIVYETKYLSYLILRSTATHNDNFTLEYASGVEWIDDGVSNISNVKTDKGITTESTSGENASKESVTTGTSSSLLENRYDNIATPNREETQRHHTQRVHGKARESTKAARYKHNQELIKKHNIAHNLENVGAAPASKVRTGYNNMIDNHNCHDTMYKHHYPEYTRLSQVSRHYCKLHQNKEINTTNEESVESVPFAVTPRLRKNAPSQERKQFALHGQNVTDNINRKNNFNEMKTVSPESLATTASQGETRTSFGQSMPRSPSSNNDEINNYYNNNQYTTRVESKLLSQHTETTPYPHVSLVLQGTAVDHPLPQQGVQNGMCVTYPLITAPVRTNNNNVCKQAHHKSTMKRKSNKTRSRALYTEQGVIDIKNNSNTVENSNNRITTTNFIDCVETKHPMETNVLTRATMPKTDAINYARLEVTNGREWSDFMRKDDEYNSPDYSNNMSNTETYSGIGGGGSRNNDSWRYYNKNYNRSIRLGNSSSSSNSNRYNVSASSTSTTTTGTSASSSFDTSVCRRCREKEMRFEERRWQALRLSDQANSTDYSAHSREWEGEDMHVAFSNKREIYNNNNETKTNAYPISNTHPENNLDLKNNNNCNDLHKSVHIQNKEESVHVEGADDDVNPLKHVTTIGRDHVHESEHINQNEFYFCNLHPIVLRSFALPSFCFCILPFAHNNLYHLNFIYSSCMLRVITIMFLLMLLSSLFIVSVDHLYSCTLVIFSITAIVCELAQFWLLIYASSHPRENYIRCCVEQLDFTSPTADIMLVHNIGQVEEELMECNRINNTKHCSENNDYRCEDHEVEDVKRSNKNYSYRESTSNCLKCKSATDNNNIYNSNIDNINNDFTLNEKCKMRTSHTEDNSFDDDNVTTSSGATSQNKMPFDQRAINVHKEVPDDNIVNCIIDSINKVKSDYSIKDDDDGDDNYAKQLPTEAMLATTSAYSLSPLHPISDHTPYRPDTFMELNSEVCHVNQVSWLEWFTLHRLYRGFVILLKQVIAFAIKFAFIMAITDLFSFVCSFTLALCRTSTTSTPSFTLACLSMIDHDWHNINYVLFALYALSNLVRGLVDKYKSAQKLEQNVFLERSVSK